MPVTTASLDAAFPTVVRYAGLTITILITVLLAFGYHVEAGYVPAAGMILYKTVHEAATNGKNGNNGSSHVDR